MGIGRSIAYQYDLPGGLPQDQMAGAPIRGGLAGGGQPMGTGIEIPEGLQWVDGQTQDIYRRWGDLNRFAKSMKTQFGMDVTDPDYTDPMQVKVSQAYQKAVADLYMNIDKFKNSQKMLQSMVDRGQQLRVDPTQAPMAETIGEAAVRPIEKETEIVLADFQKTYSDPSTARAATDKLATYKKSLEDRYESSTNEAEKEMLKRSIDSVQGALWDSTEWRKMELMRKRQNNEDLEKSGQIRAAVDRLGQIGAGATGWLETFSDSRGRRIFQEVSVRGRGGQISFKTAGYSYLDANGNEQQVEPEEYTMNVNSPNFHAYMVDLMRKTEGFDKITYADIRENEIYNRGAGFTTTSPLQFQKPTIDVGEVAGELAETQATAETFESIIRKPESERVADISDITKRIGEMVEDNPGTLTLPAGVPVRSLVYGGYYPKKKHYDGTESIGGEEVLEVAYKQEGVHIKAKNSQGEILLYYIPISNRAKKEVGNKDSILAQFLSNNNINIGAVQQDQQVDDWSQYEEK